jgi:hypothetical protein
MKIIQLGILMFLILLFSPGMVPAQNLENGANAGFEFGKTRPPGELSPETAAKSDVDNPYKDILAEGRNPFTPKDNTKMAGENPPVGG